LQVAFAFGSHLQHEKCHTNSGQRVVCNDPTFVDIEGDADVYASMVATDYVNLAVVQGVTTPERLSQVKIGEPFQISHERTFSSTCPNCKLVGAADKCGDMCDLPTLFLYQE
jgi:hypothetical protein